MVIPTQTPRARALCSRCRHHQSSGSQRCTEARAEPSWGRREVRDSASSPSPAPSAERQSGSGWVQGMRSTMTDEAAMRAQEATKKKKKNNRTSHRASSLAQRKPPASLHPPPRPGTEVRTHPTHPSSSLHQRDASRLTPRNSESERTEEITTGHTRSAGARERKSLQHPSKKEDTRKRLSILSC